MIEGAGVAPVFGHGKSYSLHGFLAGFCGGGVIKINHKKVP
jgi:hypothetical protein